MTMTIHPKSSAKALATALNRIIERDPPEIGAKMLVAETLADYPEWKESYVELTRQAKYMLMAVFDFGALRDEAAAIEAKNPAAMTDKEIEHAANRLREIGDIFSAAADALETSLP